MKSWTIGKRVTVGFATLLVLVIGLAVTNIYILANVERRLAEIMDDALVGMHLAAQVSFNTSEGGRLLTEYIRATSEGERTDLESRMQKIASTNDRLLTEYEQSIVREEDRKQFKALMTARAAFGPQRAKTLELGRAGKLEEAEAQNIASGAAFDAFQAECNALFNADAKFGLAAGREAQKAAREVRWLTLGVTLFCVFAGGGFAFVIIAGLKRVLRHLAASLRDGSDQMVSASSQVSAASQSLAEGASEQAASLEETSSSLEEMSSMTRRNADNAENAKTLANQTRAAADAGALDMKEMSQAMTEIKSASDNIAKIIKTIDEIAFQTNILALNAAVEAARAGEAGMGFAVVADEVRRLAQRSANAAKETADKIEDSINKSEHGVRISVKVAQSLEEIVTKACQVDQLIGEIAAASKEQSQGIAQVNTAVAQMDKVTQSNAASAEETASAAEELNAQAESLKDAVEELTRLVEHAGRTGSNTPKTRGDAGFAKAMAEMSKSANGKTVTVMSSPATSEVSLKPDPLLAPAGSRKTAVTACDSDFRDF
jgi:methyl-accepting chemotaxis protein